MAITVQTRWLPWLLVIFLAVTALAITEAQQPSVAVPSNLAVFSKVACPSGWTEYTAARGRYVVGLPSGGTLEGTAGTVLTNLEDRPVGQHSHTISETPHTHALTDPGHQHGGVAATRSGTNSFDGGSGNFVSGTGDNFASATTGVTFAAATTGLSINNDGSVASTNAPYVQVRMCTRN